MKSLLVLCAVVVGSYAMIYCPPNYCSTVKCKNIEESECDGRIEPNGGWCNCCPTCIKQLEEGENCYKMMLIGAPQSVECRGEDLYCHFGSKTCTRKTCAMRRKELKQKLEQSEKPLLGLELPNCLDDGSYHPKQCRGSQCYCVSTHGKAIKNYSFNRWDTTANCQCARDQHDYSKLGIVGKMFFCEDNGNYSKIQCTGSVCYCVDELGASLGGGQTAPIGQPLEC